MKNTFAYTVVFTFVSCFLFVLFLSFTNTILSDKIAANARFVQEKAILLALGADEADVTTLEQVDALSTNLQKVEKNGNVYYQGDFGNKALATPFSGPGLWGTISGYISFSEDGNQIVGFRVTEHNETPGLGARVDEPWFYKQLQGETIQNNTIRVGAGGTGDADKDNSVIDGISGATRTSDGVQVILNNYITQFNKDWR